MASTSQIKEKFYDYEGFVSKFKPKRTTDDCPTPPAVYEAVADWVAGRYGVSRERMVRPFWPGGDYEAFDYPEGCVVVDNPPFSFETKIVRFYLKRGIKFFLFAPGLTLLSTNIDCGRVVPGTKITYENGACVNTGFYTNLDPKLFIETAPDLRERIKTRRIISPPRGRLGIRIRRTWSRQQTCRTWRTGGGYFRVERGECELVSRLDGHPKGKAVYGRGILVNDTLAAQREEYLREVEQETVHISLSDRERQIVAGLSDNASSKGE